MKIVIIEDEPLVAEELQRQIEQIEPGAEVLTLLDSVESSLEWFSQNTAPDLILSDIQLSDGVSFEIFEKIRPESPIIFTTAYDEYAIRAFHLNSIDYLLKPIRESELLTALDKFKKRLGKGMVFSREIEFLLQDLKQGKKYKNRFLAHIGQSIVPVPKEKVAGFLKDELIFLLNTDGEKLITDYSTMDELEELLDPKQFFRANRQFLVHVQEVEGYKTHYTGKLLVQLRKHQPLEIIVSREKASTFKRWLEEE